MGNIITHPSKNTSLTKFIKAHVYHPWQNWIPSFLMWHEAGMTWHKAGKLQPAVFSFFSNPFGQGLRATITRPWKLLEQLKISSLSLLNLSATYIINKDAHHLPPIQLHVWSSIPLTMPTQNRDFLHFASPILQCFAMNQWLHCIIQGISCGIDVQDILIKPELPQNSMGIMLCQIKPGTTWIWDVWKGCNKQEIRYLLMINQSKLLRSGPGTRKRV